PDWFARRRGDPGALLLQRLRDDTEDFVFRPTQHFLFLEGCCHYGAELLCGECKVRGWFLRKSGRFAVHTTRARRGQGPVRAINHDVKQTDPRGDCYEREAVDRFPRHLRTRQTVAAHWTAWR